MKLLTLVITFSCCYTIATSNPTSNGNDTTSWCSTTPYPDTCDIFMSRHNFAPNNLTDFRYMAIQLAADQARAAHRHVIDHGPNCQNGKQETVWSDCVKLYDNTVFQLTRVLDGLNGTHPITAFDAQTWLSTALTNTRTCRDGSRDLNVADFIAPLVTSNVSQLISNGLAVNAGFMTDNSTSASGWRWLRERRLLESEAVAARPHVVVAKDGSGNFRSVQAAIEAAARWRRSGRFIIYVKRGVYRENIEVAKNNNNIIMVGEGMKYTVITGRRSVKGGYTTYSSATAVIDGLHFMARGITFSNTAGPGSGQAVALRSASDLSVFYQCAFMGYQDTLMVHSQRQFFRKCYIFGTIDFIFGNAAAVFQNCLILVRRPLRGQANVITAQGRDDPFQNTGIAVHNSRIVAAPDLRPVVWSFKTYLGRPWQRFSRTVFLKTYMDRLVTPSGWARWGTGNFGIDTCYYGEYKNRGPGASTRYRVKWRGYHVITSPRVASKFTVGDLIAGPSWLPATGVPYTAGL